MFKHFIFLSPFKSLCSFDGEAGPAGGNSKEPSLSQVIENAVTESDKNIKLEPEVKSETKVTETEVKDEKDGNKAETKTEDELSADQAAMAKTLFKALNNADPNIQKQTLRILVQAAGLDLKEIETPKDIPTEATLVDLLKEGLGEYDFLAEKLGPVLEKALNKAIEKGNAETKAELKAIKEEKLKSEYNTAIDTAFAKFDNSLEVKDEVVKLMDSFKPTGKMSHADYFKSLIVLAASNKGITLKAAGSKQEVDTAKIARNRLDAASRLASERGAEAKSGARSPSKMTLNDAVTDAAQKALEKLNS